LAAKAPALMQVNVDRLTQKVIEGLVNNMATSALDLYAAECSAEMSSTHYGTLRYRNF
jgi:hypothetical protein